MYLNDLRFNIVIRSESGIVRNRIHSIRLSKIVQTAPRRRRTDYDADKTHFLFKKKHFAIIDHVFSRAATSSKIGPTINHPATICLIGN